MKRGSPWLSTGAEVLARQFEAAPGEAELPCFDVVVVGSGYGGAVAAQRLSALAEFNDAAGRPQAMTVAVLERGLEYTPGSFPDRLTDLAGHLRTGGLGLLGNPEGLMDWRLGGDVAALVANGLGGGSLINAGVCEPAEAAVLERPDWPEPWRGHQALWQALYQRARDGLGAQPWPEGRVQKQAVMADLALRLNASCRPVSLSIVPPDADAAAPGPAQVPERACIECGDCFTGCNVGAKRTLGHTYLARAWRQGAKLYTGATVHSVLPLPAAAAGGDPRAPRWRVRWRLTDPQRLPASDALFEVRARHVVLSAGTFGSTEILMRSREPGRADGQADKQAAGLALSGRLGDGFSANGDLLSACYDYGTPVAASPHEDTPLPKRRVGPTITTQLRWPVPISADSAAQHQRRGAGPSQVLQDLTVPGALGWVFREVLTTMMVPQRWTRWHLAAEAPGDRDPYAVDEAAIGRSLLTVAYADDGAGGRLEPTVAWPTALRDGELVVRWKDVGKTPALLALDAQLAAACPASSAYLRNPLWQFMPKSNYLGLGQVQRRLLTVHPLGGCRMAEHARDGVVDPFGRVFDTGLGQDDLADSQAEQRRTRLAGRHDRTVHAGLYVLDGAIVPTALGINPLLTITALAEGAIDQWCADHGWRSAAPASHPLPPLDLPAPPPDERPAPVPTAVRFGERMSGLLASLPGLDDGQSRRLAMRLHFAEVADLPAFLASPDKTVALTARFNAVQVLQRPDGRGERDEPCATELRLAGTVRWFAIEPSCVGQRLWRTALNYLRQRFAADRVEAKHFGRRLTEGLVDKLRGASHFGAVRQLAYQFEPLPAAWTVGASKTTAGLTLPAGTVLHGAKRVGYRLGSWCDPESANPWRQLGELDLRARLPDGGRPLLLGTLSFDELALLGRHELPLKIARQANALAALRDTASLALYFGRVMFGLHMFSFRRAEYPAEVNGPRGLLRLPPADDPRYPGLVWTRHAVAVQPPGEPALQLPLTRIRRSGPGMPPPAGLPVLLIHGFGSGGIQFTHPKIAQPMAPWLAQQGHDVWVAELRTSIGLASARRQWSMDDIAAQDIPALVDRVLAETGQPRLQVVAHCIGSAMFCMSLLDGRLRHADGRGKVAGAVLMQVGPQVELPRASRARAYVALRLRQLMATAEAHSVASQDVSDAESLLDRLLGSFLYPEDQRPHYRLGGNLAKNTARVNANRSAAIFGQLFQYDNMNPELLAVLDDLLGSCNLTTYEQTAQYAFGHRLTDQAGQDRLVTEDRLRATMDFPVTLLHGSKNRTFRPRTLVRNAELLRQAGVAVRAEPSPRPGHPDCVVDCKAKPIAGYGHLDCVVGRNAAVDVFPTIDEALRTVQAQQGQPPWPVMPTGWPPELRLPSVGPWLGWVERLPSGAGLRLHIGCRIDDPGRALAGIATLLCDPLGSTAALGPVQRHPPPADGAHEAVLAVDLPAALLAGDGSIELLLAAAHGGPPPDDPARFRAAVLDKLRQLDDEADRLMTTPPAVTGLLLDRAWLRRQAEAAADTLGLALGACRQRPLLTDRDLADRSMADLAQQIDAAPPEGHAPIDGVILAGDQVYADSRVDAGHAAATRGRVLSAYHEAWSAPGQRAVLRRRPVLMTLDDHEFRNDYNRRISAGRPLEFDAARDAWRRYQIDAGPPVPRTGVAWRATVVRGFPIFLCDTRSERIDPPTLDRSRARIMSPRQMKALQDWLGACHDDPATRLRPKLIVTGSPMAPWFSNAAGDAAVRDDGWQRFPVSVADLLHFVADHEIQQVLFLSGDHHHAARAELTLQAPGRQAVRATSIVTGGLYSPYPFANTDPAEWLGPVATRLPAGATIWGYRLTVGPAGSGWTRLTLDAHGGVHGGFVVAPMVQ